MKKNQLKLLLALILSKENVFHLHQIIILKQLQILKIIVIIIV